MIILIVIGIIIMILGGIVMWKYWQDQKIVRAAIANGSITQAVASALPSPGWTYGLAAAQIFLGLVLVIWGIVQYFAGSKHIDTIKEYGSRLLNQGKAIGSDFDIPGVTKVETTYMPTVGSRRSVKV